MKINIESYQIKYKQACKDIIEALPEWFGLPEANEQFLLDLERISSWVALDDDKVVGIITLLKVLPNSFEISFLAVDPTYHRKGIGRKLINHIEEVARIENGQWLYVKTLAPSLSDSYYALTREFYYSLSFSALFETDCFWGKENPTVVLVKPL